MAGLSRAVLLVSLGISHVSIVIMAVHLGLNDSKWSYSHVWQLLGHLIFPSYDFLCTNSLNSAFTSDGRNIPSRQKQKLQGLLLLISPNLYSVTFTTFSCHGKSLGQPRFKDGKVHCLMMGGTSDNELHKVGFVNCHTASEVSFSTWLLIYKNELSRK